MSRQVCSSFNILYYQSLSLEDRNRRFEDERKKSKETIWEYLNEFWEETGNRNVDTIRTHINCAVDAIWHSLERKRRAENMKRAYIDSGYRKYGSRFR